MQCPRATAATVGSALRRPGVTEWRSQTPDGKLSRLTQVVRNHEHSDLSLASSHKGVLNYKSNSLFITSTFSQHCLNQIRELCRFYSFVQALITGLDLGKSWHFRTSFQEHSLRAGHVSAAPSVSGPLCALDILRLGSSSLCPRPGAWGQCQPGTRAHSLEGSFWAL